MKISDFEAEKSYDEYCKMKKYFTNVGAVAALANMANLGASKNDVLTVASAMDLTFDDIDESERKLLEAAFGPNFDK